MLELFSTIGFSERDVLLILMSAFFGLAGSIVKSIVSTGALRNYNEFSKRTLKDIFKFSDFDWSMGHQVIGLITGIFVGLLFVDSISYSAGSVAKIFCLAMIAGYSSSSFWDRNEKLIEALIDKKINQLNDKNIEKNDSK